MANTWNPLSKEDELADDLALRPMRDGSGSACVARKGGHDVCWSCFEVLGSDFVDLPTGTAWVRLCARMRCQRAFKSEGRSGEQAPYAVRIRESLKVLGETAGDATEAMRELWKRWKR